MSESSEATFREGHRLVQEASHKLGLPIAFAVVSESLFKAMELGDLDLPILVIHRFFLMFDDA